MLKYSPKTKGLYSRKHGLIKRVKCPLEKTWESLQIIDFDIEDDMLDSHRYTERHRYCDACHSNVFNLDGLDESEIEGACIGNLDICVHATLPHSAIEVADSDPHGYPCPPITTELRVIHTARHLSAMNDAARRGYWPLIRPVVPDETIGSKIIVSQNADGTIEVSGDYRSRVGLSGTVYWHNPYNSPLPFAAYLVPPDLEVGEQVYLVDLIEDLPGEAWNQGDTWRHRSGEATWTGETLEIAEMGTGYFLG